MRLTILIVCLILSACSGGGLYTANKSPTVTLNESATGSVEITKDAFFFASPFPARIVIHPSMPDTAFVVSSANPAGVVAIDLTTRPFSTSKTYKGMVSPDGTGLPNNVAVQSATRAFLLSASHVLDFNPTTGVVTSSTPITAPVTLDTPRPISSPYDHNNDGTPDTTIQTLTPSSPGGIAIVGTHLLISCSNYLRYAAPAVAAPGLILHYLITPTGLTPAAPILSTAFNPTAIIGTGAHTALVNNSGVIDIIGGVAQASTDSVLDMVDLNTGIVTPIAMGRVALSYIPPALSADGRFAYAGSVALAKIFRIDLAQQTVTSLALQTGADYLTGMQLNHTGTMLYVGGFNTSSLYAVDVAAWAVAQRWELGFSKGVSAENPSGVTTGVGDIALRTGIPDEDFTGPDLFALTGSPGALVTINTRGPSPKPPVPMFSRITISPNFLVMTPGQFQMLTASAVRGDGQVHTGPLNVTLQWTSDTPMVASISSTGRLTAHADGIARIHAHIGKLKSGMVTVVVQGNAIAPATNDAPQTAPCATFNATPWPDQVTEVQIGNGGGANVATLPGIVMGPPEGEGEYKGSTDGVSLGAHGWIVLAFTDCAIADGPGPDFIVFENAFYPFGTTSPFSEPAIVGVSMDGVHFTDFPCELNTAPAYPGCAGTHPVLSNSQNGVNPLDPAVSGGDIFDLATIGVSAAKYIRIVDQGLTPLFGANGTNGFDLDTIGIINGKP